MDERRNGDEEAARPRELSRRTMLAAVLTSLVIGGSALAAPKLVEWGMRGFTLDPNGFAGEGTLRAELERLLREAPGAVGIRRVIVEPEYLFVDLLCEGSLQSWSRSGWVGGWTPSGSPKLRRPWDTGTAPLPAELPLAAVQRAVERVGEQERSTVTLIVDDTLRHQLAVPAGGAAGEVIGLDLGTMLPVPELDLAAGPGIGQAIAEILASHAPTVGRIGSAGGFVSIDGSVDGLPRQFRIVRRAALAPTVTVLDSAPLDPALAFDPAAFDPERLAAQRDGIAERAGLAGLVWDWEFRRPAAGREPCLVFGVGERGPDSRVWVGADGALLTVEDASGACRGEADWCAG